MAVDTHHGGPSYSSKSIKAAAKRGEEVPRTDTKAHYRQDMAQHDRGTNSKERDPFTGPTPKRYLKNFDRGAARNAAKKARSSGR